LTLEVDEPHDRAVVSFPDLLAKAYLAETLTAFGKTFVRRSDGVYMMFWLFGIMVCIHTGLALADAMLMRSGDKSQLEG
jgi:hypothetical protein